MPIVSLHLPKLYSLAVHWTDIAGFVERENANNTAHVAAASN
jgi:hypothetical protein